MTFTDLPAVVHGNYEWVTGYQVTATGTLLRVLKLSTGGFQESSASLIFVPGETYDGSTWTALPSAATNQTFNLGNASVDLSSRIGSGVIVNSSGTVEIAAHGERVDGVVVANTGLGQPVYVAASGLVTITLGDDSIAAGTELTTQATTGRWEAARLNDEIFCVNLTSGDDGDQVTAVFGYRGEFSFS